MDERLGKPQQAGTSKLSDLLFSKTIGRSKRHPLWAAGSKPWKIELVLTAIVDFALTDPYEKMHI